VRSGRIGLALLLAMSAGAAGEPKLVDEKLVIPPRPRLARGGWKPQFGGPPDVHVSPDGQRLLYLQEKAEPVEVLGSRRTVRRLVLRDLARGTDTVLPVPAVTSDDVFAYLFTSRLFDRTGQRIVLGVGVDADKDGYTEPGHRGRMQAALYHVPTGKLTKLDLEGPTVLPSFDRTGKNIYALCYDLKRGTGTVYAADAKKLRFERRRFVGLPRGCCPTAEVMAMLAKPAEKGSLARRLVLYDPKADRQTAELPLEGKGWNLIGTPPRWTRDGRFLYYRDFRLKPLTHFCCVWDRAGGKTVAKLNWLLPVGPGPTPTTMVMLRAYAGWKREVHLHDAAAGKSWALAGKEARPLAAAAGRVLYVKWTGDGDGLFSARIAMSAVD